MAWSTAVSDLRIKLSDGPTDKLRAYKRVFGDVDGFNARFKTLEFRRVTDFTTANSPLGVIVAGQLVPAAQIILDSPENGFFEFDPVSIPGSGLVIEATYYVQYFLDSELEAFLRFSTQWLGFGSNWVNIPDGLQPSALQYATADAYQKLASRFSEHLTETYRLEDMPDVERQRLIAEYKAAGAEAREQAHRLRDEFYKRQGQSLSPLFGLSLGRVRDVPPGR